MRLFDEVDPVRNVITDLCCLLPLIRIKCGICGDFTADAENREYPHSHCTGTF